MFKRSCEIGLLKFFKYQCPYISPTVEFTGFALFAKSSGMTCCVPGLSRLLIGDGPDYDTNPGQSPYPAERRRRVAEGKSGAAAPERDSQTGRSPVAWNTDRAGPGDSLFGGGV